MAIAQGGANTDQLEDSLVDFSQKEYLTQLIQNTDSDIKAANGTFYIDTPGQYSVYQLQKQTSSYYKQFKRYPTDTLNRLQYYYDVPSEHLPVDAADPLVEYWHDSEIKLVWGGNGRNGTDVSPPLTFTFVDDGFIRVSGVVDVLRWDNASTSQTLAYPDYNKTFPFTSVWEAPADNTPGNQPAFRSAKYTFNINVFYSNKMRKMKYEILHNSVYWADGSAPMWNVSKIFEYVLPWKE